MNLGSDVTGSESRFAAFVERLAATLGHADRVAPMKAYCTGLMLPGDRKSVEPMAARVDPGRVRAAHQSLHHFVAKADWADAAVMEAMRDLVLPVLTGSFPLILGGLHDRCRHRQSAAPADDRGHDDPPVRRAHAA